MPRRKPAPIPQSLAPIQAAVYLRVSTEEQAREGYGLDVQRERCLAMATVKGWRIDGCHIFADEGVSGTKEVDGRPGLGALLGAVEAKTVQAIIVLSLDRLGRKSRLILDLVDQITEAGCELVSCKESLDTTTPTGRFVLGIFAGLAQLERDTIIERTTSGRNQRGKLDGEKGGRLPYGYVRGIGGSVTVDEEATAVVRQIFSHRRRRKSYQRIADELNTAGTPAPQGGIRWYPMTVKLIIDNATLYRGGWRNNSTVRWPAVLENLQETAKTALRSSNIEMDNIV